MSKAICNVRHRSAETRARCPICSRKERVKSEQRSPDIAQANSELIQAQKLLVGGWRNVDAGELLESIKYESASLSARELDEADDDLARMLFMTGNGVVNRTRESLLADYDDPDDADEMMRKQEKTRGFIESRTEHIDGYVTRGVRTPSFRNIKALDEYVQSKIVNGDHPSFSFADDIRDDSFASFTRSPAVAGMFARGLTRIWGDERQMRNSVHRQKNKHCLSGYVVKADNVDGYHVRHEDPDFSEAAEKEVLVRADQTEVLDFVSSRDSGYGIPVVIVRGNI